MDNLLTRTARKKQLLEQIKSEKRAALIVNAQARRGQVWFREAKKQLQNAGFTITGSYEVKDPVRLPQIVEHAVASGAKFVIVGGGDGTISTVVDYLARRNIVLGILPLGTGNSFARTIGIPLSLDGAVNTILNGKVVDVDLGIANGDYFANIASIGFNARVVHSTPNGWKRRLGVLAYLLAGVRELFRNDAFSCRLEIDGETREYRTQQIIIANGAFYGVNRITPGASADDRVLRVCLVDSEKKWDIVRLWLGLLKGNPASKSIRVFKTRKVVCYAEPNQVVDIDGELTAGTPISISVAQQALMVMAPQDFVDT